MSDTAPDTVDPRFLSLREAASRGLPLEGGEAQTLEYLLQCTEQRARKASDERDEALLRVKLLQRQLAHVQALLAAWQTATHEAIVHMDLDAPSPIPRLLTSMLEATSRASQENLAELKETLSRFDRVVRAYDANATPKESTHEG